LTKWKKPQSLCRNNKKEGFQTILIIESSSSRNKSIMKNIKILIAALLILIAACNKEESELNINTDDQKKAWVEGGVLHLKNQQVLDSLSIVVGTMTDEERIVWEDSLGYTSYKTLYSFITSEYMKMADNAQEIGSDAPYFKFRELYDKFAIFPDEDIDGFPNRTMEPKVTFYSCLANEQGTLIVGDKRLEEVKSDLLKLASGVECEKSAPRRIMKVAVYLGPTRIPQVHVQSCKIKRVWAWWNYTSTFYANTNAFPNTHQFEADSGTMVYLHQSNGATLLEVWNDGIGYSRKCEYNYYE